MKYSSEREETCPSWCTHHDHRGHLAWLHTKHLPLPPETFSYGVVVSEGLNEDGTSFFGRPSIGMHVRGTIPIGFQPEDARRLAAGLIRAAEIVEARLTSSCVDCKAPIAPEEGDRCCSCTVARPTLRLVTGDGA